MQTNLSLMLNVLLLIGVVIAIGRMMKSRRQQLYVTPSSPSLGQSQSASDDIIAVRKVRAEEDMPPLVQVVTRPSISVQASPPKAKTTAHQPIASVAPVEKKSTSAGPTGASLMMFLLAKENRQLAGYELLQTVLAAGLRFGEGHLFHRHQSPNGQGPVLCSLAAATASGVFDMQNIGAFSVRGLCLFMQTSGNPTIDTERFAVMLDTAKQLSEGLDTYLLDEERQPLSDASLKRYYQRVKGMDVGVQAVASA